MHTDDNNSNHKPLYFKTFCNQSWCLSEFQPMIGTGLTFRFLCKVMIAMCYIIWIFQQCFLKCRLHYIILCTLDLLSSIFNTITVASVAWQWSLIYCQSHEEKHASSAIRKKEVLPQMMKSLQSLDLNSMWISLRLYEQTEDSEKAIIHWRNVVIL